MAEMRAFLALACDLADVHVLRHRSRRFCMFTYDLWPDDHWLTRWYTGRAGIDA